jgi:hypothetical protein
MITVYVYEKKRKRKRKEGAKINLKLGFKKISVGWVLEIAPNPLPPGIGALGS